MDIVSQLAAGWSAFYHRRVDGTLANGFVTDGWTSFAVDAAQIEHLTKLPHLYETVMIDGTPIIQVRRKVR